MTNKKCVYFFLSALSVIGSTTNVYGMTEERTVTENHLLNSFTDEMLEKIILEMPYAHTGAEALKNIYWLSRASTNFQRLIHDKLISKKLIESLFSHYYDLDRNMVKSLCSFTNKEVASLSNRYWNNACSAWTYLDHAVMNGEDASVNKVEEVLAFQLEAKDLNYPKIINCFAKETGQCSTLLRIALRKYSDSEKRETIEFLIKRGANINARNSRGETCLIDAVLEGNQALVQFLIDNGADINTRDNHGNTCLIDAVLADHQAMVQSFLDKGLDINARDNYGNTCLFYAAQADNQAMVQFLIDKDADINARDNYGNTCLVYAVLAGRQAMVQFLIYNGADINTRDNDGNTCLFILIQKDNTQAMIQFLINKGHDINARDKDGNTCLFYAALRDKQAMVQFLIDNGADINAKNNNGSTYLDLVALRKGRGEYAKYKMIKLGTHTFNTIVWLFSSSLENYL